MISSVAEQAAYDWRGAADRQRLLIIERLRSEGSDDLAADLDRCNQEMTLRCLCCGDSRIARTTCKRRWCPICARVIAAKRVEKYQPAVNSMNWPLFVTWTRPNLKSGNLSEIRDMRHAHVNLRRQPWWKRRVRGGILSCEITNIGNGWHPHLHSLIDCEWLSVTVGKPRRGMTHREIEGICKRSTNEVAAQWALALGVRRATVHVKRAYHVPEGAQTQDGSEDICKELLKYSVKGSDLVECEDDITPLIRSMIGSRLVTSFGSMYRVKFPPPADDWEGLPCREGITGCWRPEHVYDAAEVRAYGRARSRKQWLPTQGDVLIEGF